MLLHVHTVAFVAVLWLNACKYFILFKRGKKNTFSFFLKTSSLLVVVLARRFIYLEEPIIQKETCLWKDCTVLILVSKVLVYEQIKLCNIYLDDALAYCKVVCLSVCLSVRPSVRPAYHIPTYRKDKSHLKDIGNKK